MRILWLSHFLPYPSTGHGALQRSHHLLRQACQRHEVHLVALSPAAAFPDHGAMEHGARELARDAASVDVFPLPADAYRARRVRHVLGAAMGSASYWDSLFWVPEMLERVRALVAANRFDLVHVDAVFLSRYLEAAPGVPVVLNHHNLESHLLFRRADSAKAPWARWFFRREAEKVEAVERALGNSVAMNLTVSDLDGMRLREVAKEARVATVANGVDVDFFRAGETLAEAGRMVFAGGMDWFPNRDAMLYFAAEIFPALVADDPSRRMTVIGRNPPAELTTSLAHPGLEVHGFVDDVRPFVERAAVYVCPIRVGGGTRLKILDALAMARPLVSTAIGVEGIGLEEGVHYLEASTPEEFVRQIRRLEADPELGRRLAREGRAFVERNYSWQTIAVSLHEAYAAAVGHPAPSGAR